jgi:heme-degrading monooxygenase HmoA
MRNLLLSRGLSQPAKLLRRVGIRSGGKRSLRSPLKGDWGIVRARMIGFKVPSEKLEEVENAYLTSFVPEMEKQRGYAFVLLFRNEDTNETFEISIWEDEDALRESAKEGGVVDWKTNMIENITGNATVIENYELRLIT